MFGRATSEAVLYVVVGMTSLRPAVVIVIVIVMSGERDQCIRQSMFQPTRDMRTTSTAPTHGH